MDPATAGSISTTTSTREHAACYPIDFIPNTSPTGIAVRPTISSCSLPTAFACCRRSRACRRSRRCTTSSRATPRASPHRESVTEPQATFSTCFGAPFMSVTPTVYAKMLGEKMARQNVKCWLVNTGWSGAALAWASACRSVTPGMIRSALDGSLARLRRRSIRLRPRGAAGLRRRAGQRAEPQGL